MDSKKISARRGARVASARRARLQSLSLSFSVAALLAACGGAGSSGSDSSTATGGDTAAEETGDAQRAVAAEVVTSGWVHCANEGGICTVPSPRNVRYGANGTYVTKSVSRAIGCGNADWPDPL